MSEIMELRQYIVDEIKKARPEITDNKVKNIQNLLSKATPDDIYRVADMFHRFDVETVFEILAENKERERLGA